VTNDYELRAAVQRVLGPNLQHAAIAEQDQAAVPLHAAVMTCEVISDYARLHDSQLLQRVRCDNCHRAVSESLTDDSGGGKAGWLAGQSHWGPTLRNRYANCAAKRPCYHGFPEPHAWVLNIIGFGASRLASAPYGKANGHPHLPCVTCPKPMVSRCSSTISGPPMCKRNPELGCC
jgi:hypothetical protein